MQDVLIRIGNIKIDLTFGSEGDGLYSEDFVGIRRVTYITGIESYITLSDRINEKDNELLELHALKMQKIYAMKNVICEWVD